MPRAAVVLAAVAAALALVAVAMLEAPARAQAHPLGNFTINTYNRVEPSDAGIAVFHVLDMAEIPAFQERQRMDADGDGSVSEDEAEAWASAAVEALRGDLRLRVDGRDTPLAAVAHALTFPPGQGGLLTLRLSVTYTAALPDGWRERAPRVDFEDASYAGRIGWRETVVRAGDGAELTESSVPAADETDELRAYPQGSLSSPLDHRTAMFAFRSAPGAVAAPTADTKHERATRGNPDSPLSRFTGLIAKDRLAPGVVALALLAALGFGMLHALSPGHGKTVVGAYLVGSRGTARHALLLGAVVTATHTSSVYAIGFVTLYLSEYVVPERIYPWLGIASGALIVAMGLALLVGRLRSSGLAHDALARLRAAGARPPALAWGEAGGVSMARARAPHPATGGGVAVAGAVARVRADGPMHVHDDGEGQANGHEHTHGDAVVPHRHGFGRAHSHRIPGADGEPVRWTQLVGLGVFGGMLPCPSAIVVMLSAVALHRVAFGLLLIVAFSLGLAFVLTAIGLALVWSQRVPLVRGLFDRADRATGAASILVRALPVVAAAFVTAAGAVILARAAGQL